MSSDKYSRSVSMLCGTCGGSDFEFDADDANAPVRCAGCDRVYETRDELIRLNQRRIDEEVDEVKGEIVRDLNDTLKRAFKGSKFIKFK